MSGIFKHHVNQLEPTAWGLCEEEQKKEFLQGFEKFNKELSEAISSMSDSKKLDKIDEQYKKVAMNYNGGRDKGNDSEYTAMINHFKSIFTKWNETITARLGDDVPNRMIKEDIGPRSELEYWRL